MTNGSLLLVAHSALESRIITSFLEAADYEVKDHSGLLARNSSPLAEPFDAAVLVLDDGDSSLREACDMIREATQRKQLPIVAVLAHSPTQPLAGVGVLVRPIRLFDLVHAVDEAVAETRGDGSAESPNLNNIHA